MRMQPTQRGLSIYNALLFPESSPSEKPASPSIGRSPELINKRDEFLLHRFYFKTKIERKAYPDVFDELSEEVYLSKIQIQKIISAKIDDILRIKSSKPDIKDLRSRWPHINWESTRR